MVYSEKFSPGSVVSCVDYSGTSVEVGGTQNVYDKEDWSFEHVCRVEVGEVDRVEMSGKSRVVSIAEERVLRTGLGRV